MQILAGFAGSLCNIYSFLSRREVYGILKAEGILLPRYAVLNRDPNNPQGKKNREKISTISISYFHWRTACA